MAGKSYYAYTAIKHDGEFIPAGTKITASMLPKEIVKHMYSTGSVVDYDPMATNEPEVEEIELDATESDNEVTENAASEEGTGE